MIRVWDGHIDTGRFGMSYGVAPATVWLMPSQRRTIQAETSMGTERFYVSFPHTVFFVAAPYRKPALLYVATTPTLDLTMDTPLSPLVLPNTGTNYGGVCLGDYVSYDRDQVIPAYFEVPFQRADIASHFPLSFQLPDQPTIVVRDFWEWKTNSDRHPNLGAYYRPAPALTPYYLSRFVCPDPPHKHGEYATIKGISGKVGGIEWRDAKSYRRSGWAFEIMTDEGVRHELRTYDDEG